MSSSEKDARWGLALYWLRNIGLDYDDLSYGAFHRVLDAAQRKLSKNPSEIPFWAEEFNAHQD